MPGSGTYISLLILNMCVEFIPRCPFFHRCNMARRQRYPCCPWVPSHTLRRNQICHARSKQNPLRIRPSTSSQRELTVQQQTVRTRCPFVQSWRTLTSFVLCSITVLRHQSSHYSVFGLRYSSAVLLLPTSDLAC